MNRFLLIDGKRFELLDDMLTLSDYDKMVSEFHDNGWVLLHHRPMSQYPNLFSVYGWRP
jgi:hypothetical protein